MPQSYFSIILATGINGEFAYNNNLPWPYIKEDMNHFKNITTKIPNNSCIKQNIVIMGRSTYESMKKTLDNRITIVISKRTPNYPPPSYIVSCSLDDALTKAFKMTEDKYAHKTYLIGGKNLILEGLEHPMFEFLYKTTISAKSLKPFIADMYLNIDFSSYNIIDNNKITTEEYNLQFTLSFKTNKDHPEQMYLNLCRKILESGTEKMDRTKIGTLSLWGQSLSFDMAKNGFPLYTTKKVFWRGIVEELLFFISGKTDTKILENKNIKIWQGNTSREFLNNRKLNKYDEGEMGPMYGFQWRHYGAQYKPNFQLNIGEEGIDQLQNIIDDIKTVKSNPFDSNGRRLFINSWNSSDISKMVLAPCHQSVQFSVDGDKLHCLVSMRSNDIMCGNPYNVASYALLTYMICYLVKLTPGQFVINMADAHIYNTHIDNIKQQLSRPPRKWPKLDIVGNPNNIDDFTFANFKLTGYNPHPAIKVNMAI
jgi:thymidylate synthase